MCIDDDSSFSLDDNNQQESKKFEGNRYAAFWKKLNKQEPKLSTFISSKLFCIELKSLIELNVQLCDKSLFDQLDLLFDQFSNEMSETLILPESFIQCCIDNNNYFLDDDNRARNSILVCESNHIWGILCLRWSMNEPRNSNHNLMLHNLNIEMSNSKDTIKTTMCGKGRFFQPLNVNKIDFKKDSKYNVLYVQQVHSNYIDGTTDSCHFDENQKHEIGFVWYHFRSFVGGDIAHMQNMSGIGSNCKNFCLMCVATQQEHREFPEPINRTWETRQYTKSKQGNNANILFAQSQFVPFDKAIKKDMLEGFTRNALYDVCPLLLIFAVMHIREGLGARALYAMLHYVNTKSSGKKLTEQMKQEIIKDNNKIREMMLDMIEKEEKYLEILAIKELVKNERLEKTIDYNKVKSKLNETKNEFEKVKKQLKSAIDKKKSAKGRQLSKTLMAYNIREFNPVPNSMQGRSASNFVNNWNVFEQFFDGDKELQLLYSGMMIRLKFIFNGMLKKNCVPYTDKYLERLKKSIVEFDALYKKYIKRITDDSNRFGYKLHYLYHCWEWCKFFKFSPAWIDDQRCEAFNLRLKRYWSIFASAMNHTNLLKMANTMIKHTVTINPKCMINMIKDTNKLFEQFHEKYYDRDSFDETEPIVKSDQRYQKFQTYHGLTTPGKPQ